MNVTKIALIAAIAAIALLCNGCVVLSWEKSGRRNRSFYVCTRSPQIVRVIHLPDAGPRHPDPRCPWEDMQD